MPINTLNPNFRPNPLQMSLGVHIGFVKRNDDAQRMGRLSVYIPELGGDPDDPGAWVIVGYASPFAGATDPAKLQAGSQTMDGSQQSYGFWMIPPDLNNEVGVFFANNDISRGYWFCCCYQTNMNHMVPGIATDVTTLPVTPIAIAPVVEYNKSNVASTTNPRRPQFDPLANGLVDEGLMFDNERGSSSTSARREAPSQVYGFLSPRGNTVHIDDNTANEFIRLRTRSGAQVLIHETTGYVYINSKKGNSWIEISDSGVDIFTAESISMRSELDFNIRADRDINMDAGNNFNMRAGANITMAAGSCLEMQATSKINLTANHNIEVVTQANLLSTAANDIQLTAGLDYITSIGNNYSLTVTGTSEVISTGSINVQSAGDITALATGNVRLQSIIDTTILSGGVLRTQSQGDTSLLAGGNQLRAGTLVFDTPSARNGNGAPTAPAAPVPTPDSPSTVTAPVLPIGLILGDARQALINPNTTKTIWKGGGGQVNTIVPRMPTHEPWKDHPNADVPPAPTTPITIDAPPMLDAAVGGTVSTNTDGTIAPNATASNVNTDGTINDAGCTAGKAGTKKISTVVYNAIMNAATKTGADPACMLAFADIESSFQPGVSAKVGSATGLYQFILPTWQGMVKKYGAKYNVGYSQINDPVANALMGGQFLCDNAAILKGKPTNIANPTPGQLYIVHFAGSSGGPAMLAAAQKTPDQSASLLFPGPAKSNPNIFNGKTIAQVVAHLSSLADTKAAAYAGQYGLPAPCERGKTGTAAVAQDQPGVQAAALTAPQPINMNTQPAGSFVSYSTGVTPTVATPQTVPVGGSGPQPGSTSSLKPNASGYSGPTTQSASLLSSAGLSNPSQWSAGSTDPATWSINQPIAIFGDNSEYGNSRAAIFLGLVRIGNPRYDGKPAYMVYDQAPGQPAQERIIYYGTGSNNAGLYAAIQLSNMPQQFTGSDRVKAACVQAYPNFTGNCSGFVNAVGKLLNVTITGQPNTMVQTISTGNGWTLLPNNMAALASAQAGNFVVAGLNGSQQATPNVNGHVVVIVDGPTDQGYPSGYWGALGSIPGAYRTINYAWKTVDLPKLVYAAHPLS